MKLISAAIFSAAVLFSGSQLAAAQTLTAEDCPAWLTKFDVNGDGSIGTNEDSRKYIELMTKASRDNKGDADNVTGATFLEECQMGTFGTPSM